MLRDGLQCVFDPVEFIRIIRDIAYTNYQMRAKLYMNVVHTPSTAHDAKIAEMMKQYLKTDLTTLYPDKVWVNTFYESEFDRCGFRLNIKITSLEHGVSTLAFSAIMFDDSEVANIMYDNFGMIPKITEYGIDTEQWLRHRFQNLIWEQRDIDKLVRMVEDPLLKFTLTTLLEEFLEKTTEYEWSEATMVLLRAIHDRKEGRQEEEKPMRL